MRSKESLITYYWCTRRSTFPWNSLSGPVSRVTDCVSAFACFRIYAEMLRLFVFPPVGVFLSHTHGNILQPYPARKIKTSSLHEVKPSSSYTFSLCPYPYANATFLPSPVPGLLEQPLTQQGNDSMSRPDGLCRR
jgi:hypothetical protein